jgi:hypothetical protein
MSYNNPENGGGGNPNIPPGGGNPNIPPGGDNNKKRKRDEDDTDNVVGAEPTIYPAGNIRGDPNRVYTPKQVKTSYNKDSAILSGSDSETDDGSDSDSDLPYSPTYSDSESDSDSEKKQSYWLKQNNIGGWMGGRRSRKSKKSYKKSRKSYKKSRKSYKKSRKSRKSRRYRR